MQRLDSADAAAAWLRARVRGTLQTDSRRLRPGDGFLAWPGARHDARTHVAEALALGAAACLVEAEGAGDPGDDRIAALAGLKRLGGPIAAAFHGHPSREIPVLAVTGTNGKTSTTWWIAQALARCAPPHGRRCAVAGTLGIGFPPVEGGADAALTYTGLTTPDAVQWQGALRERVDAGAQACAVEASSIGIAEHRLDGTTVRSAVFTNFTQDHLDYHGSMQAYWQAKERLFHWPDLQAAVVNIDDDAGAGLARSLPGSGLDLWTTGLAADARLRATEVALSATGMSLRVHEAGGTSIGLRSGLIGAYNVSNLLGVIGALRSLGIPLADAVTACEGLTPVPGRLQCLQQPGAPLGVVDYAHTPDAIVQVLATLRPLARARGGRLWCLFGCGGDRDPAKRVAMGRAAAAADVVVVTSDNPRSEDPMAIIDQVLPGLAGHDRVHVQADRARAIADALALAAPGDIVLVAGKGHEATQDIAGVSHPFSDAEHVARALARRARDAQAQGAAAC